MKTKTIDKMTLLKISDLFDDLQQELDKLTNEQINFLLNSHNEDATIPYCVRWGQNACTDLLKDLI